MANQPAPSPLSFGLDERLYQQLRQHAGAHGSVSRTIRTALQTYDFGQFQPTATRQRQVSVRMGPEERTQLEETARKCQSSVGELVRAALSAHLEKNGKATGAGKRRPKARPKPEAELAATSTAVARKSAARTLAQKRMRRR